MTPRAKIFAKEYAKELISIALQDLASSRDLESTRTKRVENIFLLAQQGLEKALKAVLCWNGKEIPFVHDIGILVTLISQFAAPPFGYSLNELSEFAAIRRYHEGHEEFGPDEIDTVLREVEAAILWCRDNIQ